MRFVFSIYFGQKAFSKVEPKQMAQYFTLKYVNYQKLAVEASRFGLISEKIFVLVPTAKSKQRNYLVKLFQQP